MEKRIVLATHGMFSEGLKTSTQMIFGDGMPVECITAYVDLTVDYQKKLERVVAEHDYQHAELIVLTDVLGGSVNNEFIKLLGSYRFHLLTGLNLPLLLEVLACPADEVDARLPAIAQTARNQIVICDDLIGGRPDEGEPENEF